MDVTSWLTIRNGEGEVVWDVLHWGGDSGWEVVTPDGGREMLSSDYMEMMVESFYAFSVTPNATVTGWFAEEFIRRFC